MLKGSVIRTTRSYILRWHQVIANHKRRHSYTQLQRILSDMPGIPELVAFDRSELSKAEVKHVMREMRRQLTNKTISMKRGYMDIYLPNVQCKTRNDDVQHKTSRDGAAENSAKDCLWQGESIVIRCSDFNGEKSLKVSDVKSGEQRMSSLYGDSSCTCRDIDIHVSVTAEKGCDKCSRSSNTETLDAETEKEKASSRKREADKEEIDCSIAKKQRVGKYKEECDSKINSMETSLFSSMSNISNVLLKKFHRQSDDKNVSQLNDESKHNLKLKNAAISNEDRNSMEACGEKKECTLPHVSQYIALDCEFVGVGPKGRISHLGQCSIVNFDGDVIYNEYCKPEVKVTDHRTRHSGIKPFMLKRGKPLHVIQEEVNSIIKDKILIGHAVFNDIRVLGITHPKTHIRDTSSYKTLTMMSGTTCGLKHLTKELLGRTIQRRSHCSIEDARATLDLFKLVREEWETKLQGRNPLSNMEDDKSFLNDEFWEDSESSDESQK